MFTTQNLQAGLQRAQSLIQASRVQEAWETIAPLRQAIDRHGQALRLYAYIAQNAGRSDEAIDALKQITEVEGAIPDIVGALADTLGNAGRHDEAHKQWSRLVALLPDAADAHLNRAISAIDAGKPHLAVKAADEGLQRFPDEARLLSSKALALQNQGELDEAVGVFEQATEADPNVPATRFNQAVTLSMARRYPEACAAFEQVEKLGINTAALHSAWAGALMNGGEIDSAIERYNKVLELDPAHDESRKALTVIAIEHRDGKEAFDHYRRSAERIGRAQAYSDWVFALIANQRHEEAAEVGRDSLKLFPEDPSILAPTLFAEGIVGDAGKALDRYAELPPIARDDSRSLIARAQLGLRAKRIEEAAEWAELYSKLHPDDQIGWTVLGIVWRLLDDPREKWLCDYDRYVMVTDVAPPEREMDSQTYAGEVAALLDPLHTALDAPGDQSLRNGTQTSGSLFTSPHPGIQEFRRAVIKAAAGEVAKLPDDPSHPFLRRKSLDFDFSGSWSVRLRGGGGHHVPHFHGEGWMSSAYYARLPEGIGGNEHAGCIEFGRPPKMFELNLDPRRVVEPKVGRLVLFPSYMWHGTVPFAEDGGDRLTAAFDYQPI